ncbi:hypothetical protein FRB99_005385 [Tulasnella sp. 403]|nr:hypothetical protein FRB99_005385 [Tulasnella sp. 403]
MTSVAHRWRSLQIHTSRRDVMEVFLQTRAPEMRSLKAIAGPSHPRFDASHTELFGEIAHRLVDVDINSVSIAWGSASLTGLRSLKLLYLAGPTTAELLNVLANSPDLEELEIRDCDLQPVGEREEVVIGGKRVGIGNVEVHLPRLGSLALRGTPSEQAMIQLLEPLVIPPEAQMSVCAVRIVPRGSQLWDCLGKHMSSMDEASGPGSIMFSHDGRWAQLNYGHGLCTMSGDRPVSRFPIERLTDEPYEIWRVLRFASPVRCEMPTTLHLNRVSSDALAPFMRYVHQTIPGITELLVETMLKPVIDMLKQPVYTSRDRVPEWLYPRLTTLIVMLDPWDRDGILRLADLLRYRVEHARLFGVPAVIGTLRLVSSSVKLLPRVLEELQKVVRNVDTTAIEVGEQS